MSATHEQGLAALSELKGFIGANQARFVRELMKGEEGQFFFDKMVELAALVKAMPATYGQEAVKDPIVHLHYFIGGCDWFIIEKDVEPEQLQAFGLADLFGDGGELGYIPITEVLANRAELDFHFAPRPLSEVRAARGK